jgi:hypothetical protein
MSSQNNRHTREAGIHRPVNRGALEYGSSAVARDDGDT